MFTHLTYIKIVSNTFSWKRLFNFIPIYSSPQYVYAFFFLIEVYINFKLIIFVVKLDQKNKKIANDPQHVENCSLRNVKNLSPEMWERYGTPNFRNDKISLP
jgi:hypothetical protein